MRTAARRVGVWSCVVVLALLICTAGWSMAGSGQPGWKPRTAACDGPAYDHVVKLWDRTFGGSAEDDLSALRQTADGGYVLGGYSSSPASGDKSENSRGTKDYWVVRIDASGNKLWDKTFGGHARDGLLDLQQTADSGYILGGWSESGAGGDKSENFRGSSDYWVMRFDIDRDGDGVMDGAEFAADTNPLDSNSLLRVNGVVRNNDGVDVAWQGGGQATQIVERCTNLLRAAWVPAYTNLPPTALATNWLDVDATNAPLLFYRLRAQR